MEKFGILDRIEKYLQRFRLTIGVCVLIMLMVLSILTWNFFDKQNQIIETGGFVDGKIKCACTQEAYDNFLLSEEQEFDGFSNITLDPDG